MSNPCDNCSAKEYCSFDRVANEDKCPLNPTDRQLNTIRNSDYSARNIDTMKEASNVIEKIIEESDFEKTRKEVKKHE